MTTDDLNPTATTPPTDQTALSAAPTEPTEERTFTQADLDRIVKERLERAKKQAETERSKAEEAARQKTLAEQGEYKTIAESQAAKIAELEAKTALVERYEAALSATLEQALKGLPQHVIELLSDKDPAAQLEYLAKHGEKLRATPPPNLNGRTARATTATDDERKAREDELRKRYRIY